MMTYIFSGLILLSVVFGLLNGRIDAVSNAALTECGNAVQLMISLMGAMCMWSGVMQVAKKAGLTEKLSRLFSPAFRLLFKGMDPSSPAAQAITLNISANLLGLGNAATPLGISAMKELEKESAMGSAATDHMILFVVLNTASLQIIPTTTALLRSNAGAANPLDIMPASWVASLCSILSGIFMAKLLSRLYRRERRAPAMAAAPRKPAAPKRRRQRPYNNPQAKSL